MLKAYPKINQLGTKFVASLFDEPVEITEKIDGSQFCFGKIDGEVFIRSKGAEIFPAKPPKMFQRGVDVVMSLDLPDDLVFYGEYLDKPKHNVLAYDHIPHNHIALFGIANAGRDAMDDSYENLASWAKRLDVDVVPLIHAGISDAQSVLGMLDRTSSLGGQKIEGVVIKNYKDCFIADRVYPVMAAKYVSEQFKEVHQKSWSGEHTHKGKWESYKDGFRTEARWQKAVQHLRDDGVLLGEPKDIAALIKEVQRDVTEEEKENIKTFLWREFGSELVRRSVAGLPEWYKERLALGQSEAAE